MNKSIAIISLLLLSTFQVFSQARSFDGGWVGTLEKEDGDTYSMTLYIEDNNVYTITRDSDGDIVKDLSNEVTLSKGYGQQLNFFWINSGGVWTETQMYSLSWINDDEISIYHMRHVTNESDDSYDDNEDWGYFATGTLEKI